MEIDLKKTIKYYGMPESNMLEITESFYLTFALDDGENKQDHLQREAMMDIWLKYPIAHFTIAEEKHEYKTNTDSEAYVS